MQGVSGRLFAVGYFTRLLARPVVPERRPTLYCERNTTNMDGIQLFVLLISTCYYKNIAVRAATYIHIPQKFSRYSALHEAVLKAANSAMRRHDSSNFQS
jgi:hypothetical protein